MTNPQPPAADQLEARVEELERQVQWLSDRLDELEGRATSDAPIRKVVVNEMTDGVRRSLNPEPPENANTDEAMEFYRKYPLIR